MHKLLGDGQGAEPGGGVRGEPARQQKERNGVVEAYGSFGRGVEGGKARMHLGPLVLGRQAPFLVPCQSVVGSS